MGQEMEAIDASRQHQMARRRELALAEKEADKQMAAEWLAHNRKMIAKEMEKEQKLDQRNRDNAKTLKNMANKAKSERLAAKQAEKEYYRSKFATEAKEKEKYDKYVQQEIHKYAKAGKNVKALAHALKSQSDLMPAF